MPSTHPSSITLKRKHMCSIWIIPEWKVQISALHLKTIMVTTKGIWFCLAWILYISDGSINKWLLWYICLVIVIILSSLNEPMIWPKTGLFSSYFRYRISTSSTQSRRCSLSLKRKTERENHIFLQLDPCYLLYENTTHWRKWLAQT